MFKAMVKKEFLLLLRDKHALIALFIMPAIFILIMSVALRDQFKQEQVSFDIVVVDKANSVASKKLYEALVKNESFHIQKDLSQASLKVVIPKNYLKNVQEDTKLHVVVLGALKGDILEIFKAKFTKELLKSEIQDIQEKLNKMFKSRVKNPTKEVLLDADKLFEISYLKSDKIPTSTQQSVPSWIVFGMFFVIIPMSTVFINERKQNTLARLNSMNTPLWMMILSKVFPYIVVNQLQVIIMLSVGIFIVPLFDTPALVINGTWAAIFFLSFALSISAIGVASLLAVMASSAEQATTIGGILNILLGAIGGVMVPKFIMPETMQKFSQVSPMSWGLDGFLDIFIKAGDISMVLENALMLFAFGISTLIISMIILQIRMNKGL